MPLRVKTLTEPFTDQSKVVEPILAVSDEYHRLYRDLERYTSGHIQGRSYLIAGHRGSGKTMLVHKAIEDLLRNSVNKGRHPLFVRLHGPDLLPPLVRMPTAVTPKAKAEDEGRAKGAEAAGGENVVKDTATPSPSAPAPAPVKPADGLQTTLTHLAGPNPTPDPIKPDDELSMVLTQMTKSLFRAVTDDYRRCYRERILMMDPGPERERLLELASQFDLELTEGITESLTPARLRNYWARAGALSTGILFTIERPAYTPYLPVGGSPAAFQPTDLGLQEILVLSFLSQAFQVISGKLEEKQSQRDAARRESSSTLTMAYALKNLFAPVAGLLTGAFVGISVGMTNPIAAVLLGLLTGAVVSFGFSYSGTRSRTQDMSLESVFIRDRSVATLSSVLPMLVMRMKEIGLAPVFVVDELDKVQCLQGRMQNLVRHLKFLVTENSFSCFLTDRSYLVHLNRQYKHTAYAREYTYFSDQLLILYPPDALREFVKKVLEPAEPPASAVAQAAPVADADAVRRAQEEEAEKIAYVILHRARLHALDLRRQLDRLSVKSPFTFAELFPPTQYRYEILMQLAVEWLLNSEGVQSQLRGNPDSRQVVYDALYYISRLWEDASEAQRAHGFKLVARRPGEEKAGFVLDKIEFSKYLDSRCDEETEEGQPCDNPGEPASDPQRANLGGVDFDFLFEKVLDFVNLLADPQEFRRTLEASKTAPSKPVPPYVLNEIPEQPLIENIPNTTDYVWLYDFSGRNVQTVGMDAVIRIIGRPVGQILRTDRHLQSRVGKDISLQTLSGLRVIPRTPSWASVRWALDRLNRLRKEKQEYALMGDDRNTVYEFYGRLLEFSPNMKAALMCAAVLAPEITDQPLAQGATARTPADAKLTAALAQVSQLLDLSASPARDLSKLKGILKSPFIESDIAPEDEWEKVYTFIDVARQSQPRDPAPVVDATWEILRQRLLDRYRYGFYHFEPQFEDLFTSVRNLGPGRSLTFDLDKMTVHGWASILLRSLDEPAKPNVRPWLAVAAALELNLPELAGKLSDKLPPDAAARTWVRDYNERVSGTAESRRNVLVLTVEVSPSTTSLTTEWKASTHHGFLALTVADFAHLLESLKRFDIQRPADIPIDLVVVELSGSQTALGKLVSLRPSAALMELMSPPALPRIKDIETFFDVPDVLYLTREAPLVTLPNTPQLRFVVSPKGVDDLVGMLQPNPPSTTP